jgi:hypothetical protein
LSWPHGLTDTTIPTNIDGRRTYCEARRDVVALAKQLQAGGMSLRKISAELAAQGHLTGENVL